MPLTIIGLSNDASFLTIKDFFVGLEEMENAVWKLGSVILVLDVAKSLKI
jgi:hypothetical protein